MAQKFRREEIIAQQGDAFLTRAANGVRFLNTPATPFLEMNFRFPSDAFSWLSFSLCCGVCVACFLSYAVDAGRGFSVIILGISGLIFSIAGGMAVGCYLSRFVSALPLKILFCVAGGGVVVFFAIKTGANFLHQPHDAWMEQSLLLLSVLLASAFTACFPLTWISHAFLKRRGDPMQIARRKIHAFADAHPDWNLRLYRTEEGLRVLVARIAAPADPEIRQCFKALADFAYRIRPEKQCFRVRVSAEPWRTRAHLDVRPKASERATANDAAWIERYEAAAAQFSVCHWLEQYGDNPEPPETTALRIWHDQLTRAQEALPLA
jgi:hypothetical protein